MMGSTTSALATSDLSLATRVQGQGGKGAKGQGSEGKGGFGDLLAGAKGGAGDLNRLAAQFRAQANSDGKAANVAVEGDLDANLTDLLDTLSPDALKDLMASTAEPATPELGQLRDALAALRARMAEADAEPRKPAINDRIPEAVIERLKDKLPPQSALSDEAMQAETDTDTDPEAVAVEPRHPRGLDKRLARDDTASEPAADAAAADDALRLLNDRPADAPMPVTHRQTASGDETAAGAGDGDGSGERRIRIVRADGKGGALELPLDRKADMPDDPDVKARPVGMDTVTVVDSRRFLGLAPSDNAANMLAKIAGDPEWTSAMQPGAALQNAAAQASTGKVVNTLKLQMHPIDLGPVTATMRVAGDELSIEIRVETGAAYRQLSDDQSGMIDNLRQQGFAIDKITVLFTPPDTGDQAAGQQNAGNGNGFGQAARDGERGAGEGQGSRRAAEDDRAGRERGHDHMGNETGLDGAAPRGRPSSVYL